uniref:Uncharacterized protein n=1 Tax=Panagrolaimus sp. PS1159 TaxID=55785 RepID=A0AC35FB87_9BILA
MLNNVFVYFILAFMINFSQSPSSAEISHLKEIKPSSHSLCKMYGIADMDMNLLLKCLDNHYQVQLINFSMHNYTGKTYCIPSPQFAVIYYNRLPSKLNATICKQKHISYSNTFKLYCHEAIVKKIDCADVYLDIDKMSDVTSSIPPKLLSTTTPTLPPTTSIKTLTPTMHKMKKPAENINYTNGGNEASNCWTWTTFIFIVYLGDLWILFFNYEIIFY